MLESLQNQEGVRVSKNRFPILAGWLFAWLYVLVGILLLGFDDFDAGPIWYPWMLLLNPYLFFPVGQIILIGLAFAIGMYVGKILRFLFPNLTQIKGNSIFATFLVVTLLFAIIWSSVRNGMPYYIGYTEAKCAGLEKGWFTSKYILKEKCFHEVAKATKNPLVCNNLKIGETHEDTFTKGFCLEEVAHITKDPATCELISPYEPFANSDRCLGFIRACERIKDSMEKNNCFGFRAYNEAYPNGY